MIYDDTHHYILYKLGAPPQIRQCGVAHELGNSLGKADYCPQARLSKEKVQEGSVGKGDHNKQPFYGQMPLSVQKNAAVARPFLMRKLIAYVALRQKVQALQQDSASTELEALIC